MRSAVSIVARLIGMIADTNRSHADQGPRPPNHVLAPSGLDQGAQFTAQTWTGRLESAGVAVSMDGRGRALDNVFVERLWRAVKYEDIYIRGYDEVSELRRGLTRYFAFYNHARLHQALGYRTPAAVYTSPAPCALGLSLPASEG